MPPVLSYPKIPESFRARFQTGGAIPLTGLPGGAKGWFFARLAQDDPRALVVVTRAKTSKRRACSPITKPGRASNRKKIACPACFTRNSTAPARLAALGCGNSAACHAFVRRCAEKSDAFPAAVGKEHSRCARAVVTRARHSSNIWRKAAIRAPTWCKWKARRRCAAR